MFLSCSMYKIAILIILLCIVCIGSYRYGSILRERIRYNYEFDGFELIGTMYMMYWISAAFPSQVQ